MFLNIDLDKLPTNQLGRKAFVNECFGWAMFVLGQMAANSGSFDETEANVDVASKLAEASAALDALKVKGD